MDANTFLELLRSVARGEVTPEQALPRTGMAAATPLANGITLDPHRHLRTGLGEVVLGLGKSPSQLVDCVHGLAEADNPVLATRITEKQGAHLVEAFPDGTFHDMSGLFILGKELGLEEPWPAQGEVMVVTAGSSDLRVALEAYGAARFFGLDCGLVCDVGVAGVHRLNRHMEALTRAQAVIAVAGMDGALPSLLAGLLSAPVIAVPSSQGGDNPLGALASLLAMLNSCSPGIATVNVDNGFGAASFAAKLIGTHPANR